MITSGLVNSTQISGLLTQTIDYESLFSRLKAGHTLVTGNSRLARVIANLYSQWRIDQGDSQWPSPVIVSWNGWLDQLWEIAALRGFRGTDKAIPGHRQLISLWESAIKNAPLEHQLIRPESLAEQLHETRKLIHDWQLNLNHPAWHSNENENHRAFYQWNRAFEKRCKKDNWLSPEDRSSQLCEALRDALLTPQTNLDLLGFDEFNPGQASLLSALNDNGNSICQLFINSRQCSAALWKSRDGKEELQQMARWARHWIETEPESSIAIVVPDLQNRRDVIERHLHEILTPGENTGSRKVKPWNLSMGIPLLRVPMIQAAFDLLKFLDIRIDIQDVGRILRSPWLRGADDERNNRALLEKCLRDKYPRQIKPGEVEFRSREINQHDRRGNKLPPDQHQAQPWNCPGFNVLMKTLLRFEKNNRGLRQASGWAEALDQLLLGLGWPLENELPQDHDHNWQTLQAWRDALRELASLDTTLPAIGRNNAINQLRQICRGKIFQPSSPPAPLQVLGLYEISGLRFDHLWVVGLHNDNWPAGARPNPFIPAQLQTALQLPHSNPQRELEVARNITRRLLETSPDCVFSYPGQIDGEAVLPSPLLITSEIEEVSTPLGWRGDTWLKLVADAGSPQADPLLMPGKLTGAARGGSSILKHQALCPFRAFASNRLAADGLETPAEGISAMLHGSLVHKALEYFWKETASQAALLALDEASLKTRVRRHVVNAALEERGLQQRPAFLEVEIKRVCRHVLDYLELEKQRDSFEVVGFEKEILPEIEGQTIHLVIDRIDRLPSGEEIIIDYKTGKEEPKKWFGDRPENPQLPLYAISADKVPAAVAFGIIRDDGCHFRGVVSREGLLPGLPPKEAKATRYLIDAGLEMPGTIQSWRQTLHHLMSDFLAGQAAVDPKHGLSTCNNSYCQLQSLCRIAELMPHKSTRDESGPPEAPL